MTDNPTGVVATLAAGGIGYVVYREYPSIKQYIPSRRETIFDGRIDDRKIIYQEAKDGSYTLTVGRDIFEGAEGSANIEWKSKNDSRLEIDQLEKIIIRKSNGESYVMTKEDIEENEMKIAELESNILSLEKKRSENESCIEQLRKEKYIDFHQQPAHLELRKEIHAVALNLE